jgi:DNA-directed RNA polymerase specialized sigma24 family protein
MADDAKARARKAVRRAQSDFERTQNTAQQARRQAFMDAQKVGLSLREIADEVGMHRSRIHQIIRGD